MPAESIQPDEQPHHFPNVQKCYLVSGQEELLLSPEHEGVRGKPLSLPIALGMIGSGTCLMNIVQLARHMVTASGLRSNT